MTKLQTLTTPIPPFWLTDTINHVVDKFLTRDYKGCLSVAVVDNLGCPQGTISRYRLNEILLKKYGRDLFGNRPVSTFMNPHFLQISVQSSLNQAVAAITDSMRFPLSEDFVITDGSHYIGMGAVLHVLEALETELQQKTDELQRLNNELQRLNLLDGLTGVANRRCFDESLALEWQKSERSGQPLSLLMVDVDNFKAFNDSYGHVQGDNCLKQMAQTMAKAVHRSLDLVARYGGEEFAIILPETDKAGAVFVAERVLKMVRQLNLFHAKAAHDQRITVSIGAATLIADPELTQEVLLQEADHMLYQAKKNGKDQVAQEQSLPLLLAFAQ